MGDGAGIMVQIPHAFFAREMAQARHHPARPGEYVVGFHLLATGMRTFGTKMEKVVEKVIEDEGQTVLGWRDVPFDNSSLQQGARNRRH